MQKFQNMEHSNSRTFKGLEFFPKFKDFSRTLWTLDWWTDLMISITTLPT